DKDQAIITCCASGIRSAGAQKLLSSKGYTNVVNGGGWSNLERKLQ
ncbi:MAG: phage shock protein E, partial [Flavobacteriales bacterium]